MSYVSKDMEANARKGYSIPDTFRLFSYDSTTHVMEFRGGGQSIQIDTSSVHKPPFEFKPEVRKFEVVPEQLISPGSANFLRCKAIREYAASIVFTCKLCAKSHPAPGVDMMNGVALFPKDTLETAKDDKGQHFARCIQCPPKAKAKPQDPNEGVPALTQRQLVVTKTS